MLTSLNHLIVGLHELMLAVFRLPLLSGARVYSLRCAKPMQPIARWLARHRAVAVARMADARVPAYGAFLREHRATRPNTYRDFETLPITTKSNYVRTYPLEERCIGGRLPTRGVVIDESSGSSGEPNDWVRGRAERRSVRRLLRHGMRLTLDGKPLFFPNCFALGPWATGMNISMSLADDVILKSLGPDAAKLERTLRRFGPGYRYVVAGYPPFVKDAIDSMGLDLSEYEMHLIVGGEGISEPLRDYLLRVFENVWSSYGASDLEINLAGETAFTIALRRLCAQDANLCRKLFGRDDPPMIFQYDALNYHIESTSEGELIFTLLRSTNVAPKVRYNLRDLGGAMTMADLDARLRAHAHDPASLGRQSWFPILFVSGRNDLSVPFYGAKVLATEVEGVLSAAACASFTSFRVRTERDESLNEILIVDIERPEGAPDEDVSPLAQTLHEGLARANQDFREVSRLFGPERIKVRAHPYATGPFADQDRRVKNRYV